ncbi:hypothetical protein AB0K11_08600 [Mycobacterium sp. NPDC050551]|uniref:hypothetical protein n=1 Tax=Mycobacterium sp. NPDC050551 TaxID=3155407 RepID=UPI003445F8FD
MVFVFSYSEQLVSQLFPPNDTGGQLAWRIAVIVVDAAVLGAVGVMKRAVTRADGDGPRLWGWWWTGVVILIGIDALRLIPLESIRIDVLTATVYAAAMGVTIAASLNADPLTLLHSGRRVSLPVDWGRVRAIVPLVVGAWLCYLAASAYVDYFDVATARSLDPELEAEVMELPFTEQMSVLSQLCEGAISPVFFQQVVGDTRSPAGARSRIQLLPENLDRRRPACGDRGHRDGDVRRSGGRPVHASVGRQGLRGRVVSLARVHRLPPRGPGHLHRSCDTDLAAGRPRPRWRSLRD